MQTSIFKVIQSSSKRGYNRTIEVYRMKNNYPHFVGYNDKIDTASYRGDKAEASKVISNELGYKMKDSYNLARQDVQLIEA